MGFLTKLSLIIVSWGIWGGLEKKDEDDMSSIYMLVLTLFIVFW